MLEARRDGNAAVSEAARLAALQDLDILDTPPEAQFDRIACIATMLFGTPTSAVTLVDDVRQWFKAKVGLDADETPRSQSFCAHVMTAERVMVVEDARQDRRFADNPLVTGAPNIRFYAGAPLTLRSGETLGALCVIDSVPRSISAEQRRTLEDLAAIVVDALELGRANRRLSELAATDSMTGLMNRRAFLAAAQREIARVERYGGELAVMMLDIDRFKLINDRFGHEAGDHAIVELAQALSAGLRSAVLLCRLGGDEFAIALPQTSLEAIAPIAERLLELARALRLEATGEGITISVGSTARLPSETVEAALNRADQALYQSKRDGRDRARWQERPTPQPNRDRHVGLALPKRS